MIEAVTDIEKLREIAIEQHGYVTTAQADESGVSRPSLTYLTKNGRIERSLRGVYRVPQIPTTQYDAMQLALLWTGTDHAVLSHDTALSAWNVSDVNPTKIHITVPKNHRIDKAGGENIVLYKQNLEQWQVTWWEQMLITKLPLTIEQCIDRRMPSHIIIQSVENGRTRGLLLRADAKHLLNRLDVRNEKQ